MSDRPDATFVTFHSFKGGVGRTLALYNVGLQLAAWGRRVLLIDADLEAPGLTLFLRDQIDPGCPGFLGAWQKVARPIRMAVETGDSAGVPAFTDPADLAPFLQSLKVPEAIVPLAPAATLDLMPAGVFVASPEQYSNELNALDLAFLYDRRIARAVAQVFRAWIRTRPYDYVLVDSRTGLNLVAELCVGDLADAVVLLTGLNEQNLLGTEFFLKRLAIDKLPPERRELVLTPVPTGELELRRIRIERVSGLLGSITGGKEPLQIPYDPRLALLDEPMLVYEPEAQINGPYRKLSDRVAHFRDDDRQSLMERITRTRPDSPAHRLERVELLERLAPLEPSSCEGILRALTTMEKAQTHDDDSWVWRAHHLLSRLQPEDSDVFYNWGVDLSMSARARKGKEADRFFEEAFEKYSEALRFKPDKHEALNNWGCALSDQAKTRSGEEADGLFGEAREKFAEALRVKPDKHGALYNWGTAYLDQARTRSGEEADRLLREAEQRLGEAEELSPGSSSYNLACVCALSGRPADAQRWLETALKHGDLPDDSHIETDTDLDSVRKEPWFEALLETRRKK